MTYIPYPSSSHAKTAAPGRSTAHDDAFSEYSTYRRVIRTVVCATLFAVPLCVSIPMSPLLKLSQTQENKKSLVPRMMSDFFYVNFAASAAAYWWLVEPFLTNRKAKEGFMPYLGPLTAQIPGGSCLIASHLFYPGLWAIVNEPSWPLRRREFVRLNMKCFVAYAPQHVPAAVGLSAAIGLLLYPFKYVKLVRQREADALRTAQKAE